MADNLKAIIEQARISHDQAVRYESLSAIIKLPDLSELIEAAERWNGLLSCDRIRMMGATNDLNHVGMEFWRDHESKHPSVEFPQETSRDLLERFALRVASDAKTELGV